VSVEHEAQVDAISAEIVIGRIAGAFVRHEVALL
jgi:hypothetical protein